MTQSTETKLQIMKNQMMILGILCILLAPLSILFGLFGDNPEGWYGSISKTYYANSKAVMIGLLIATGIYFISYKGYDKRDNFLTTLQGLAAIGLVIFPTKLGSVDVGSVGLLGLPSWLSVILHCACTYTLFISFWINLMFLFTLSNGKPTPKKRLRNIIYRCCGVLIILGTIAIIAGSTVLKPFLPKNFPIALVGEFVILIPFGFAYLVKSECIKWLNDE